jgi:hypothetical protein
MKYIRLSILAAAIVAAVTVMTNLQVAAQEGHPLHGTWYGDFGSTPTGPRRDLTVVLKWDGTAITGTVNPGKNAVPIKTATLTVKPGTPAIPPPPPPPPPPGTPAPEAGARGGRGGGGGGRGTPAGMPGYLVKFEIDAKNKAGGIDKFVFEGEVVNPVAGNRRIRGTWTCGPDKGSFDIRRY